MPGRSAQIDALRPVFRSFKRTASRLRDGWEALGPSASLKFAMDSSRGRALEATFDETPALIRWAALLRPFMADGSRIELRAVWASLQSIDGLVGAPGAERITELFAAAEKLPIAVVVDGRTMDARDARFNAARAFIKGHGAMPHHLLILQHAEPGPSVTTHWQSFDAATGVQLDLFGPRFAFNLEPTPFGPPPDAPPNLCIQVWLGEGTRALA